MCSYSKFYLSFNQTTYREVDISGSNKCSGSILTWATLLKNITDCSRSWWDAYRKNLCRPKILYEILLTWGFQKGIKMFHNYLFIFAVNFLALYFSLNSKFRRRLFIVEKFLLDKIHPCSWMERHQTAPHSPERPKFSYVVFCETSIRVRGRVLSYAREICSTKQFFSSFNLN